MATHIRIAGDSRGDNFVYFRGNLSAANATTPFLLIGPDQFPSNRLQLVRWFGYVDGGDWLGGSFTEVYIRGTDGTILVGLGSLALDEGNFLIDNFPNTFPGPYYARGIPLDYGVGAELIADDVVGSGGTLTVISLWAILP